MWCFPSPATVNTTYPLNTMNLRFTDGNAGWRHNHLVENVEPAAEREYRLEPELALQAG